MWEVTAAVIATALGIVVLPFATSLTTDRLNARRDERRRRLEIFEELVVSQAHGRGSGVSKESVQRENELRAMLYARMGPGDNDVRDATGKAMTYAATREENAVMRAWVFGHRRQARKLARLVIAGRESRSEATQAQ